MQMKISKMSRGGDEIRYSGAGKRLIRIQEQRRAQILKTSTLNFTFLLFLGNNVMLESPWGAV